MEHMTYSSKCGHSNKPRSEYKPRIEDSMKLRRATLATSNEALLSLPMRIFPVSLAMRSNQDNLQSIRLGRRCRSPRSLACYAPCCGARRVISHASIYTWRI